MRIRCLLPGVASRACPLGRVPREDPEQATWSMSLSWPGKASESSGGSPRTRDVHDKKEIYFCMFSITLLNDGKVKSFFESNCQLLFIVFIYVCIFLFRHFLISVSREQIYLPRLGKHFMSNYLCITHLRSTSALQICPSKRPKFSNIFCAISKSLATWNPDSNAFGTSVRIFAPAVASTWVSSAGVSLHVAGQCFSSLHLANYDTGHHPATAATAPLLQLFLSLWPLRDKHNIQRTVA